MRIIKGNKQLNMDKKALTEAVLGYKLVEIDLGTGDGRFVYKKALDNPKVFFIGIDPAEKQLEIFSRKAVRKKLNNLLFVVGSIEILPEELVGIANKVYINMPWGTLLESIVKPVEKSLYNLRSLLKPGGTAEIVFGYAPQLEPSETKRLSLPDVSLDYIKSQLIPVYENLGFKLLELQEFGTRELESIQSTWGKGLKMQNKRHFFRITTVKQ